MNKQILLGCMMLASLPITAQKATITVDVNHPDHPISPTLFGIFLEDINLAVDGGLYPELVRNRSFEDADTLCFWQCQPGQGHIEVAKANLNKMEAPEMPLNPNNRQFLRIEADGAFTVTNPGYWGMNIEKGATYDLQMALRRSDQTPYEGSLGIRLMGTDEQVLAQSNLSTPTNVWHYVQIPLTATGTHHQARLEISGNGKGTLYLDMVSLIPRDKWGKSGVRRDLGMALNDLHPTFFRFPGGCWVEGEELATRYQWKQTIGAQDHRIPLWNLWGYKASHGIGYHEYLQLAEDLGAEPLFCINAGVSHKETIPSEQLDQWIQDALDAIEYANGPVTSVWGAARARNGHPEPFGLKYIEIGNENYGHIYFRNFELMSQAIKARYPEMQIVANDWSGSHPTLPTPALVDEHYYNTPDWFILNANMYDKRSREEGSKIFIGEYAVTGGTGRGNLRGAVGEAAFMTGLERNSDLVAMAAYAPLFCNVKHQRWPINLINYDSHRWYGLPSYYVQQLFAENQGTQNLPVNVKGGPVVSLPESRGGIGLGTWKNSAEFKELKVTTPQGKVLYANDFQQNIDDWEKIGQGDWSVSNGVLRQASYATGVTAFTGSDQWTEYVITLKARKLSGENGFQIYFHHLNGQDNRVRWDIGGYSNSINELKTLMDSKSLTYKIEEGRWYDIRLEVSPMQVRGYIDGELIQESSLTDCNQQAICSSAALDERTGDIIVKVVNAGEKAVSTSLVLQGAERLSPQADVTVLTSANATDENSLDEPHKVIPVKEQMRVNGPRITRTLPANSVTIIRFHTL